MAEIKEAEAREPPSPKSFNIRIRQLQGIIGVVKKNY